GGAGGVLRAGADDVRPLLLDERFRPTVLDDSRADRRADSHPRAAAALAATRSDRRSRIAQQVQRRILPLRVRSRTAAHTTAPAARHALAMARRCVGGDHLCAAPLVGNAERLAIARIHGAGERREESPDLATRFLSAADLAAQPARLPALARWV